MDSVLQVKNLKKIFGNFTAVNDISFTLNRGEILGLLGPNGAGKTTTIQMLLSIMTPSSGSIYYFGKSLKTHRSEILEKVAFASTYVRLPSHLTIEENLNIYAQLYGISKKERESRIKYFLTFFDLWDVRSRESGVLSAGQITRVMLAKAFISKPTVVLLDEPTASLDPDIAQQVRKFILEQQQEHGTSILLTSHNMDEVTEVCDRVLVLQKGTIIANNTPEQLAASVKNSHIHLLVTKNQDDLEKYLVENGYLYAKMGQTFDIEINEHKIGQFLHEIAKREVWYEQISIEKPSLEDYFLQVAQASRNAKGG